MDDENYFQECLLIYGATGGIPGPQGGYGFQGIQGIEGMGQPGFQGLDGLNGTQGAIGWQGIQGIEGSGPMGYQGIQGVQGSSSSAQLSTVVDLAGTTGAIFTGLSSFKQISINAWGMQGTGWNVSRNVFIRLGDSTNFYGATGSGFLVADGFVMTNINRNNNVYNGSVTIVNADTNTFVSSDTDGGQSYTITPTAIDRLIIQTDPLSSGFLAGKVSVLIN